MNISISNNIYFTNIEDTQNDGNIYTSNLLILNIYKMYNKSKISLFF